MEDTPTKDRDRLVPQLGDGHLFDDDAEDNATVVHTDALFMQRELPDYPAIGQYGRFELLGRLALGGMAEIFLARETMSGQYRRHLVIKRVLPHVADDEDFIRMFLDEARIAIRLYHPNVCHVYEAGEVDGSYFMALEWVDGVPLRKVIRRAREKGGIPAPIAARIIGHIAAALHYAHHAKDNKGEPLEIVHRDVSPHNVMVSWDGIVKLLDFGIAKASSHDTKTEVGVIKGKYSYLAPEQCHGADVDARSDIFALGICLYEALTGKPLYHRGSVLNTMTAIVNEPVPSARAVVSDVSPELDAIVKKSLAKDPADRYQTARQMHDALSRYLVTTGEIVDPRYIGDFLDTVFTQDERAPLSPSDSRQTGSYPSMTPTGGHAAESGSFGPFGQRPPRPEVAAEVEKASRAAAGAQPPGQDTEETALPPHRPSGAPWEQATTTPQAPLSELSRDIPVGSEASQKLDLPPPGVARPPPEVKLRSRWPVVIAAILALGLVSALVYLIVVAILTS